MSVGVPSHPSGGTARIRSELGLDRKTGPLEGRGGRWVLVERSIPERLQRIRSVS
jgi:hypothetical protein